jgi:hypothetical protein
MVVDPVFPSHRFIASAIGAPGERMTVDCARALQIEEEQRMAQKRSLVIFMTQI